MAEPSQYSAQSIKILKGLEAVKKRPGMYIGNTDDGSGLHHMIYEVVDNSIDESLAGYCDKIIVKLHQDGSVSVIDNGRGIPIDKHEEEGISAAELIMTHLHAGGKFDNNSYKVSGGLHGVGVSVVNALSQWLVLTIWREGKKTTMKFVNGLKEEKIQTIASEEINKTGTQVRFYPSKDIFLHTHFNFNTLKYRLRELAFLNPKLYIELYDLRINPQQFVDLSFEGGILDFIKFLDKDKHPIHETIHIFEKRKDITINAAFQWNDSYTEHTLSFTNNIKQKDGGVHLTGFKSALTRSMHNYAANNTINKKNQPKLSSEDTREGLTLIISVYFCNPKFSSQTKDKLISSEIRSIIENIITKHLTLWLETNPRDGKKIVARMLKAANAREAARKARDISRQQNSNNITCLPGKISHCQEKNPSKSELFLVEGDSAGGSAKQARDRKTQAILALKGKILNVEKSRFDKVLSSQEIGTIITALKLTVHEKLFICNNLRYHKIIIMTDADVDGLHIQTLLLTFFFRYLPQLITNGYLYIAQPPLFKIKRGKNNVFLKDKLKLDEYLHNILFSYVTVIMNNKKQSKHYTIKTLKNILVFADTIQKHDIQIPDYIIEILVLQNYFYNLQYNKKTIIALFNKQHVVEKATWEISIKYQNMVIKKSIRGVQELYKVYHDLLDIYTHVQLKEIHIDINKFLVDSIILFKEKQIYFETIIHLKTTLLKLACYGLYVQRFKGLGEMNPEQLWSTTLDPRNRILLQVKVDNNTQVENVFAILMGDNVEPRKKFIIDNALNAYNIDS